MMWSRRFITAGWWGYLICAAIYVVASARAGDWLNLSGSLFFFLATVCFIIPHYWDHKERSDD